MRGHRSKPEPMEGSEYDRASESGSALHPEAEWRRHGLSRMSPFVTSSSTNAERVQDLGNSNFSIHLPRSSFDRNDSAKVVLRAIQSLGLADANVNERNDICVGKFKISPLSTSGDRDGGADDDVWFRYTRLGIRIQDRQQTGLPPRDNAHLE